MIEFLEGLDKDGRIAHEALQNLRLFQTELVEALLEGEAQTQVLASLQDEFSTLAELTAPLTEAQKQQCLGMVKYGRHAYWLHCYHNRIFQR